MAWHDGLTERQRRFCEAYAANGGNGVQAARSAGYSTPQEQASENLRKPKVVEALEALRHETTQAAIATREERQAFWTAVLRGEVDDGGAPPPLKDRIRAAELLGKSQGDFLERKEVSGPGGGPVQTEAVVQVYLPSNGRECIDQDRGVDSGDDAS